MPEPFLPPTLNQMPDDTARAVHGSSVATRYILIGDSLSSALVGLDLDESNVTEDGLGFVLPSMVTLLQFEEGLSDEEAADAMRTRLGWKYALHLPLNHPGLMDGDLAGFRTRLQRNASSQRLFRIVLVCLQPYGLCAEMALEQDAVEEVIATVDTLNTLAMAANAMALALEALAAEQGDWLREISLPHWYERYGGQSPVSKWPEACNVLDERLQATLNDIAHLLRAVDEGAQPAITNLPEIRTLRSWADAASR